MPLKRQVLWKKLCLVQDSSDIPYLKHPQNDFDTILAVRQTQFHLLNQYDKDLAKQADLEATEFIIEISRTKTKFFIIGVELQNFKFHTIDLHFQQASKIVRALNYDFQNVACFLEMRHGSLCLMD